MKRLCAIVSLIFFTCGAIFPATRLKELISIEGVRDNLLIGYGLVVGLAGTGDRVQTVFSAQSLTNLLERMGLTVSPTAIQVKNTAAVMVTATLPPFSQPGARIDVTAAAIGDAPSLQGGILLMTGLKGPDGQVYAVAQGALVLGRFRGRRSGKFQIGKPSYSWQNAKRRHCGARRSGCRVWRSVTPAAPASGFCDCRSHRQRGQQTI